MHRFPFALFRFFGILPFNITKTSVHLSKPWHIWSLISASILICISLVRSVLLLSKASYGLVFTTLGKIEPFWAAAETIIWATPLLSTKNLKNYLLTILKLKKSTKSGTNKMLGVVIFILFEWCVVTKMTVRVIDSNLLDEYHTVALIALIQTYYRSATLLHFYVVFHRMIEHLNYIKNNTKNWKINRIFDEYEKVLKSYKKLGKIYEILFRCILLRVFFDCIVVLKRIEDFFIHDLRIDETLEVDVLCFFWYSFHVPLLMLVVHKGQVYHQKVHFLFKTSEISIKINDF